MSVLRFGVDSVLKTKNDRHPTNVPEGPLQDDYYSMSDGVDRSRN